MAALAGKYLMLDQDARLVADSSYAELATIAERYIVRRMVKEANSAMASKLLPGWFATLLMWGPSFQHLSSENPNYKLAVEKLTELSEQFDSKEATTLLKKFKNVQDVTSDTPWLKAICAVFKVEPKSLK